METHLAELSENTKVLQEDMDQLQTSVWSEIEKNRRNIKKLAAANTLQSAEKPMSSSNPYTDSVPCGGGEEGTSPEYEGRTLTDAFDSLFAPIQYTQSNWLSSTGFARSFASCWMTKAAARVATENERMDGGGVEHALNAAPEEWRPRLH